MIKHMYIKIITAIILILMTFTPHAYAANSYDDVIEAFKESAWAFYQRGKYVQYNSNRTNNDPNGNNFRPEDATVQHRGYLVCSGLTRNVYYDLLGIYIPTITASLIKYAEPLSNDNSVKVNPGVVAFGQGVNNSTINMTFYDEPTNETIENTEFEDILQHIKIGDVLTYTGHTALVYDLIKNQNEKVIDALIIESVHGAGLKSAYIATKTIQGNHHFYYNWFNNTAVSEWIDADPIIEGTIHIGKMSKNSRWGKSDNRKISDTYSILRFIQEDDNGNAILAYDAKIAKNVNLNNTVEGKRVDEMLANGIKLQNKNLERIRYSKLYIEKTAATFNNNTVEPNQILTYKITIKNNSLEDYDKTLFVTEKLSEYVTYESSDTNPKSITDEQIVWNIGKLKSKEEVTINYSVKVKANCIDQTIESFGYVGSTGTDKDLPNSIVRNRISHGINEQNSVIEEKYNLLKNKYNGKELIDKIYKEAFNVDLNIKSIDLSKLIQVESNFPKGTQLKNLYLKSSIELNNKHNLYNIVFNNYYNGLACITNSGKKVYDVIRFKTPEDIERRADTIYSENFMPGDILIYKNSDDTDYYDKSIKLTNEDGEYAYIYIDGKGFVGINLGNDNTKGTADDRNEFNYKYYEGDYSKLYSYYTANNIQQKNIDIESEEVKEVLEYANYQTLIAKDYYVILRPSLAIDIVPMELEVAYSTTNFTNQDVTVTITSNEKMLEVEGWNLSEDKLTLTKTYKKNTTEELKVYDYGENEKTVEIKIENIDKASPVIRGLEENKEYYTEVTLKVEDENLKEVKLYKDEEEVTFEQGAKISEAGSYKIVATDKAGNKSEKQFIIYVKGDASGDGKFTETDLFQAKRHIVELEKFTPEQIIRADMNGDEKITLTDLTIMKVRLVKLDIFME